MGGDVDMKWAKVGIISRKFGGGSFAMKASGIMVLIMKSAAHAAQPRWNKAGHSRGSR
jgi:hypothetical protein